MVDFLGGRFALYAFSLSLTSVKVYQMWVLTHTYNFLFVK